MAGHVLDWVLVFATPLACLFYLTCLLVWLFRGRHDTAFTRFCELAMAPSILLVVGCLILTAFDF